MIKLKCWIAFFIFLLLLFPLAALAAPVGKITNLTGIVDVTVAGQAARIVSAGQPVNIGDFIRTKSKSKVEITFNEGNIMRLAENTRVGITEYMSGAKRNSSIFNLFRGKTQNIVKFIGSAGGRYEVHTPTAVCGVRGTHFFNFYLAGVSGSIFQEGTGYGYSKNNPHDLKTITAGQGMFVPSATMGAQLRSISNQQLDEMKNATEISGSSSNSGSTGDPESSDNFGIFGSTGNPPPPPSAFSLSTPTITIPPPVQPLQTSQILSLNISPATAFTHQIDGGATITGITSDSGITYSLTASGGMYGTADYPGAGLVNGATTNGSTIISGLSGYMMGLPNASQTGAKALLSTVYVDNDGQAGFLLAPLTAIFTTNSFSGTGLAYKYAPIATTGFTPSTFSLSTLSNFGLPSLGNISLSSGGFINFNCSNATCQSEAKGIDVSGGKIGVWGGYSYGGIYSNGGNITSFINSRAINYDPTKKAVLYSDTLTGAVDTATKEVSISGDFSYLSTLYKGAVTMNHFGYYDSSNIYSSISSGTIQLQPMAFANELSSSLMCLFGIMGSSSSIWTNTTVPVTMIGTYASPPGWSGFFIPPSGAWESKNYLNSGTLTNDGGGAYKGYANSLLQIPASGTGIISTDFLGLYADISGNIGILRGNIPGTVYYNATGFESEGILNRIAMATGTTTDAATFVASGTTAVSDTAASFTTLAGNLSFNNSTSETLNIPGSYMWGGIWGIGRAVNSGTYSGDPRVDAAFSCDLLDPGSKTVGTRNMTYTTINSSLNSTEGYFEGNVAGAASRWDEARTYVIGGTVKGIFKPTGAETGTWDATALTTQIESSYFIYLASTDAGRAKLAALGIPYAQVGSVNMSLSGGADWTSLNINSMGFYANTAGGKPQIWAAQSVTGIASGIPSGTATLSGNAGGTPFSADFVMRNWSGGNWGAEIKNGVGGFNGSSKFTGGAAGTYSGSNITSGTASGVAH
ncbi:MAG: FecR family protein [Smithella sp.]